MGLLSFCNNLKHGLYTELGKLDQENIDLSEGQWQRIEIARLLYADRAINILDEPTAALDPVAESEIYELFRRIRKNRFVIYITHRLGSAKTADEILVLKDGHIAEQGSIIGYIFGSILHGFLWSIEILCMQLLLIRCMIGQQERRK